LGQPPLGLDNLIQKSLQIKKISAGWVKKYPGKIWWAHLLAAGQKYAWVG